MKTIMSFGLLGVACYYPEVTIASIIGILIILDLVSKCIRDKGAAHYSSVKEVLNDENSLHYIPERKEQDVQEISIHLGHADSTEEETTSSGSASTTASIDASTAVTTASSIEKAAVTVSTATGTKIKEHQGAKSIKTYSNDSIDDSTESIEECTKSIDYRALSYREIQILCREAGIKGLKRKKGILISLLESQEQEVNVVYAAPYRGAVRNGKV